MKYVTGSSSLQNLWLFSSTYSRYRHQMAVIGQFHSLATVPLGKVTLCPKSRGLDGPQGRWEILEKNQM